MAEWALQSSKSRWLFKENIKSISKLSLETAIVWALNAKTCLQMNSGYSYQLVFRQNAICLKKSDKCKNLGSNYLFFGWVPTFPGIPIHKWMQQKFHESQLDKKIAEYLVGLSKE